MNNLLEWLGILPKYNLTVVNKLGDAEVVYAIKTNDLKAFNYMVSAMEDKTK